jgi:hypothetical protein
MCVLRWGMVVPCRVWTDWSLSSMMADPSNERTVWTTTRPRIHSVCLLGARAAHPSLLAITRQLLLLLRHGRWRALRLNAWMDPPSLGLELPRSRRSSRGARTTAGLAHIARSC